MQMSLGLACEEVQLWYSDFGENFIGDFIETISVLCGDHI